jgi:hypothetical protein
MSTPADAGEQRKLRSVARRYERDGYRVTMPGQGGNLPAFLEGFAPDLIAESEQDRVVIEVKRSDTVRGSNNPVEIAERVSREPGWRFELVTIPSVERVSMPTAEDMDFVEKRARQAMDTGLADTAYVYVLGALEVLLSDVALRHGLRATRTSLAQIARDLVSRGIISREVFDKLQQAHSVRNLLVHAEAGKAGLPSVADVEDLLALMQHLRGEMATETAD